MQAVLVEEFRRLSFHETLLGPQGQGVVAVEGFRGSSRALLAASLPGVRILVCGGGDEALSLRQDLMTLLSEDEVAWLPGPEILDGIVLPLRGYEMRHRLRCLLRLEAGEPLVVVTTMEGLLSPTLRPELFRQGRLRFAEGDTLDLDEVAEGLCDLGYQRQAAVGGRGEFSLRGGLLDVFSPHEDRPVRIELFDDEVETIKRFDCTTQRSRGSIPRCECLPAREFLLRKELVEAVSGLEPDSDEELELRHQVMCHRMPEGIERLLGQLPAYRATACDHVGPEGRYLVVAAGLTLERQRKGLDAAFGVDGVEEVLNHLCGRGAICTGKGFLERAGRSAALSLPVHSSPAPSYGSDVIRFVKDIRERLERHERVYVTASTRGHLDRLAEILEDYELHTVRNRSCPPGAISLLELDFQEGFCFDEEGWAVFAENDLWGGRVVRESSGASEVEVDEPGRAVSFSDFTQIEEGSLVVHVSHGVGRFTGLQSMRIDGVRQEFLEIVYAKGDKLFVPVTQLDRVQRFIGVEGGRSPKVNRLGGLRWQQVKGKVRIEVEKMARELLKLYASRDAVQGFAYSPDTVWQREFEESFPFEDTKDQQRAMVDIKRDMGRPKPMERLICGDVGYGKTELAVRAAFKAVQDGKQAAVLVPTTILAQQHFHTFMGRLSAFPVKVAVLSRLRSKAQQSQALKGLKTGTVDVVIGTHRLLSKDVKFKDLGLLVVDEEQRFGVRHKERIKQMSELVDVLTLTATPIPRTLNMALTGIRDISVINTPPRGRLPIKTFVTRFEDAIVAAAIRRELQRGGQIYYVYNAIRSMGAVIDWLHRLVPEARIRGGHGQMDRASLERLMVDFYEGDYDVLVSTTIIESGLDIPNVNTLVVHDATRFGLSQLYQLRGRVGRTMRQAYSYLLYPSEHSLSDIAFQRLKAMEDHTELGSGFRIAMRDLELRGAGNLLGPEQHGFVQSVGFELYAKLLRNAVAELKGAPAESIRELCLLEVQADAFIPDDYVSDGEVKLEIYRRLGDLRSFEALEELREEMADRFGAPPDALGRLFRLLRIKVRATALGLSRIKQESVFLHLDLAADEGLPADLLAYLMRRFARDVQFKKPPGNGLTLRLDGRKNQQILALLEEILWPPGGKEGEGTLKLRIGAEA